MATKQLNVELPEDEIQKAKKDAVSLNVALAAYVGKALQLFRREKTKEQRQACFGSDDSKTVGRKISA